MSKFRELFGLDLVDVAIQATLTGLAMGFIDSTVRGPDGEGLMMAAAAASVVIFGIRRQFALRKAAREPAGLTTGQMAAARLEELERRAAQMEAVEARVLELEERLDFTERMLAQSTGERQSLPAGERR